MSDLTPKRLRAFWAKVDKNGPVPAHNPDLGSCWVWTGARLPNGYGSFGNIARGGSILAHRTSWEIEHGREADLFVLHHCDNRACVRPGHLYEGTKKDNSRDMLARGRCKAIGHHWLDGEKSPYAKLTTEQVLAIRERYAHGELQRVLAAEYGVRIQAISRIIRRERWAWLNSA